MKRMAAKVAVAVLSVIVSLGLVEASLRVLGVETSESRLDIYKFDPVLGWVTPKSKAFYRSSSYWSGHFSYYDAEGLPTSRAGFEAPPDRKGPSVLLVGDSFVESYYLPYEQTFPYLLARSIGDRKVVNLGVSGYGPEQYLLRLRAEAPKYDVSDVVVVFFAANDVPFIDELTYEGGYAKPVFGDDFDRPTNTPLPEPRRGRSTRLKQRFKKTATYVALEPLIGRWLFPGRTAVTHEELMLDERRFDKAVAMMAAGRALAPEGHYHVVYMAAYEECVDREALEHNLALFQRSCGRLRLSCHVAPFAEMPRDTVGSQYIPHDGHLTAAGAATMAPFLEGVLGAKHADGATPSSR